MVVGVCYLDLVLPEGSSLKGKRRVIKGLLARVRSRFNVSIAEVGGNDLWQRAQLGICLVGNDRRLIDSLLEKVIEFIEGLGTIEVISSQLELLHFNYDEG